MVADAVAVLEVGRVDDPSRDLQVEAAPAERRQVLLAPRRALGGLRSREPGLELDNSRLRRGIERTLAGALRLIDWRSHLERSAEAEPVRPLDQLLGMARAFQEGEGGCAMKFCELH